MLRRRVRLKSPNRIFVVYNPLKQSRRVGADGLRPVDHARGRPLQMRAVLRPPFSRGLGKPGRCVAKRI